MKNLFYMCEFNDLIGFKNLIDFTNLFIVQKEVSNFKYWDITHWHIIFRLSIKDQGLHCFRQILTNFLLVQTKTTRLSQPLIN